MQVGKFLDVPVLDVPVMVIDGELVKLLRVRAYWEFRQHHARR